MIALCVVKLPANASRCLQALQRKIKHLCLFFSMRFSVCRVINYVGGIFGCVVINWQVGRCSWEINSFYFPSPSALFRDSVELFHSGILIWKHFRGDYRKICGNVFQMESEVNQINNKVNGKRLGESELDEILSDTAAYTFNTSPRWDNAFH